MKRKVKVLVTSVVSDSLRPHGLQPARLLCPWDSPGKNTGVGSHSLLQGIFPTQGSNPGLRVGLQADFYHLSHQGRWGPGTGKGTHTTLGLGRSAESWGTWGKGRIFVSYFQLRKQVGVGRRLPGNILPIFSFLGRNWRGRNFKTRLYVLGKCCHHEFLVEATIESVFQQEGALCQPVASNHAKVTKLPRACCLGPNLHAREGAQGLVTSGQTHWLFSLQPVPLCPHLSGSLPFCSPWGQSGKWAISTGHSHGAHNPAGLSSQNTCGVCCAGVYFQIPLAAPFMGVSRYPAFQALKHGHQ